MKPTHKLLHGKEKDGFGDSGYTGAEKRQENQNRKIKWHIAMKPSALKRLDGSLQEAAREIERLKASIRAKVEHPFRVIKRQFGHRKVRYRGLEKNRQQLYTLFAMSNLWMVRKRVLFREEGLRNRLRMTRKSAKRRQILQFTPR